VTFWDSLWNGLFLLYGTGQASEGIENYESKMLGSCWPKEPTLADDLGQVLVAQDRGRIPIEATFAALRNSPEWPEWETQRTINRAIYLQKNGLIPENVEIPFYVFNNKDRGISNETILITLLIRGGMKLLNELSTLKAKQTAPPKKDSLVKEECESCRDYETLLADKKKRNTLLELENRSLKAMVRSGEERFRIHIIGDMALAAAMRKLFDNFVEEISGIVKTPSPDGIGIRNFARSILTNILTYNCTSLILA
jgi:hypothetical protein